MITFFLFLFLCIVVILTIALEYITTEENKSIKQREKQSYEEMESPDDGDIEELNYPILHGHNLYTKELEFLSNYSHIIKPKLIIKDDFYYCVYNFRCSKLSNVPYLYVKGVCSKYGITNYKILKDYTVLSSGNFSEHSAPLNIKFTWKSSGESSNEFRDLGDFRTQMLLE